MRGVIGLPEALVRGSAERRRAREPLGPLPRHGGGGLRAIPWRPAASRATPAAPRHRAADALLLKAQAARVSGDRDAADAFQRMVDDPETRVLEACAACSWRPAAAARTRRPPRLPPRPPALAPSVTWANEACEAQSADGDWAAALETIERRSSLGLIDKATARRQRAVLLTAIAGRARGRRGASPRSGSCRRSARPRPRAGGLHRRAPPRPPRRRQEGRPDRRRRPGRPIPIPTSPRSISACAPAIRSATVWPRAEVLAKLSVWDRNPGSPWVRPPSTPGTTSAPGRP
ncbi:hypothetical protein ACU4GA_29105 [Methylobacterium oryzae CBMB20]